MTYIAVIAVIGILLLQLSGAIPLASVGGSLTIGLAYIFAVLAVAIHEAWTQKRGVLGWIVNIAAVFAGVFVAAQVGGFVIVMLLAPFMDGSSSLAKAGGGVFAVALAAGMLVAIAGAWGALWVVNRWRDKRPAAP